MSLKSKLALRLLLGLVVVGALLFVPAGSLRFWQGWAYLMVWFVPTLFAFGYFYKHDPQLVVRRLRRKEAVGEQKLIIKFGFVTWLIGYLLPGLDRPGGTPCEISGSTRVSVHELTSASRCDRMPPCFFVPLRIIERQVSFVPMSEQQ